MNIVKDKYTIVVSFDKLLKGMNHKKFYIKYPANIISVPNHLINYMISIILSEVLSWNTNIIYVSELTRKQEESINYHIRLNFKTNRYKRCQKKCSIIKCKNYVDDIIFNDYGPKYVCNGLGRDGILLNLLAKDIYDNTVSVTVKNQYKTVNLFNNKYRIVKKLLDIHKIKDNIIETNYMQRCNYKVIPWWIFNLPLLYINNSNTILVAMSIDECCCFANKTPFRLLTSYKSIKNISDTLNINLSSPFLCISSFLVQKILYLRYPHALHYHLSCMSSTKWCNNCVKCYVRYIYLKYLDYDTTKIGLNCKYSIKECINKLTDIPKFNCIQLYQNNNYHHTIDQNSINLMYDKDKFLDIYLQYGGKLDKIDSNLQLIIENKVCYISSEYWI